ncbi:uncharacterized protein TRAVEDRAFT_50170 [Trametes versicolor FP-101664 SS1]|uniref:uncharacterized protein n=1 Tax=Trametes versicolor (strain FP-101664) TaxID=717944 RepID=UPI0004622A2E|nr:uncharacterized protein TRAVEDRAFT_50170 [Trametes versicolor FP-101664 SS1]EIW55679.1 hypothetical protein TRAVEDRAFT_50170 [Trametes versicolor FP-101664 SS1]
MSPAVNATQTVGVVTIQSLNAAVKYCTTAASALLIWHHLLTFDREVAFFWKRKFSGASGLFFANRYLILVYSIYNLLWEPLKASNVAQFRFGDSTLVPFVGCTTESAAPVPSHLSCQCRAPNIHYRYKIDGLRTTVSIVARVSVIVADVIVMALTWATTHRHQSVHVLGVAKTLSSVMYRNGAMYFIVLTIINVLYLVSYSLALTAGATASGVRASFFYSVINDTFTRLTAILMTHFLLDLQEAANAYTHPSGDSQLSSRSILQFARADVDHWIRELRTLPPIDFTDDDTEQYYGGSSWAIDSLQPRDIECPGQQEIEEVGNRP